MKHISTEEFFSCDVLVQKRLLKWKRYNWKKGDMFSIWENLDTGFVLDIVEPLKKKCKYECTIKYYSFLNNYHDEIHNSSHNYMFYIPLLTIDDLIKYLEHVNRCRLNITFYRNNYEIIVSKKSYKKLGNSLLYALWQIVNTQ